MPGAINVPIAAPILPAAKAPAATPSPVPTVVPIASPIAPPFFCAFSLPLKEVSALMLRTSSIAASVFTIPVVTVCSTPIWIAPFLKFRALASIIPPSVGVPAAPPEAA